LEGGGVHGKRHGAGINAFAGHSSVEPDVSNNGLTAAAFCSTLHEEILKWTKTS
jgi:hypothetical protein